MMGNCLELQKRDKTKMSASTYQPVSGPLPAVVVHFYGQGLFTTSPLPFPHTDLPMSCEDASKKCAAHLSDSLGKFFRKEEKIIGPLMLPMFGLYAADHDLQLWLTDAHIFESDQTEKPVEFYFRVKVQPVCAKIPDGVFLDYLFWQVAEDFRKGRVWTHFDMGTKIKNVDRVLYNLLLILVAGGNYPLSENVWLDPTAIMTKELNKLTKVEHVQSKVTLWNVDNLLPKQMKKQLRKDFNMRCDFFMRYLTWSKLHTFIKDFFEQSGKSNLCVIRKGFVANFIKEVPHYLIEYFPAENDEGESRVKSLVVRPHQDGCVPGLYFNKKLKAPLRDIFRVDISESGSAQDNEKFTIVIHSQHQPPMFLTLKNEGSALSFLSVLESHCRLKVDYHSSLSMPHLAPPSLRALQHLQHLRTFGPMEEVEARRYLGERKKDARWAQCDSFFMLYQNTLDFQLLHATGLTHQGGFVTLNLTYSATWSDAGPSLQFRIEDQRFDNMENLVFYLSSVRGLGRLVIPQDEDPVGAMRLMGDESVAPNYYSYSYVGNRGEAGARGRGAQDLGDQPLLYQEDQVSDLTLIGKGEFSDKFRFRQKDLGRDAVLKKVTSDNPAVQDSYRKGAERLLQLRPHSRCFVQVYGFLVASPLRLVLECAPEGQGSLLARLRSRGGLNWQQTASVLKQLADVMCTLKDCGLLFGSFCCAKIMIWKERDEGLTIKLSDPSLALFCDSLPGNDEKASRRLPWLAPERRVMGNGGRGKPAPPSLASEMYAVGTTLWEMVWCGKDPIQCIPSNVKPSEFFARGNTLPAPVFTTITAAHGDTAASDNASASGGRTEQWVAGSDFGAGENSEDNGSEVGDYGKCTLQAEGSQGSNLLSGETVMTDASGGGEAVAPVAPGDTGLQGTLRRLQETVVKLMRDCWEKDPNQRPLPLTFLKTAVEVETLADRAVRQNPVLAMKMILAAAIDAGHTTNEEGARQLQETVQEHARQAPAKERTGDDGTLDKLEKEVSNTIDSVIEKSRLVIPENQHVLGEGQFGKVIKATLNKATESLEEEEASRGRGGVPVAVKQMLNQTQAQTVQFLKEALNVCKLEHPNVVRTLGIVMPSSDSCYLLVMELADGGQLLEFVNDFINHRELPEFRKTVNKLSLDVANGMNYICEEKHMVHGDLAARNVLLFSSPNGQTAKLSDFGLSHRLKTGQRGEFYYDLCKSTSMVDKMPIFWMPKEVLEAWGSNELVFTSKTDVWSFGVVLWEMWIGTSQRTVEKEMNREKSCDQELLKNLVKKYQRGITLPQDINKCCPDKVYAIMKSCWKMDSKDRPDFKTLIRRLQELTENDLQ